MAEFKAMAPKVEVNGETVLSVVDGMGIFKQQALDILKKCGIDNPQAGKWYAQQAWLEAFKEISSKVGAMTLFQIGKRIPANAKFPPEINNIEKALAAIDVAYHMNHRGGEIGHYTFTKTSDKSGVMKCPNPFPCDFDRGIITAMAEKFKPAGSMVTVVHDNSKECRHKGGESCTYLVSW